MLSPSSYKVLEGRFARLTVLRDAAAVLQWDMATMMPEGGSEARGEQLATLKVMSHEILTDPALADDLGRAESETGLDAWQQANLREMRRAWLHAASVPGDLVEALSKAVSRCEVQWRRARAENDFAGLRPALEEVLNLVRQQATIKAERLGLSIYDALLDEYEPGLRTPAIDRIFDDYAAFLPGFLKKVVERQAKNPPLAPLTGPFPAADQHKLALRLMTALGFDFDHGRLDTSHHPFCGGVPDDVRITTRWNESDVTQGMMGVVHETGHALYERGLPRRGHYQPVGQARGMAIHESQSLLVEMQVCRSPEFIRFLAPLLGETFGASPAWEGEDLTRRLSRVKPGLIRVDADEVTYPAHVILRYRLERALIGGSLVLSDLPGAWNDGMRSLLGIVPPDDSDGCLQDIHWPGGAWGYFPCYTLGAMMAAQLYAAAARAIPDLPKLIERGDFAPLFAWLRRHVHEKGSALSAEQIIAEATGRPLDPEIFKNHLARRYLGEVLAA